MTRKLIRAAFLGTASALVFAGTAQAAMIMETGDFNINLNSTTLGTSTDSQTLTYDQFDPTLGTLTGVRFDLESFGFVSGTLFGSDPTNVSGVVDVDGSIDGSLEMDVAGLAGVELTSSALSASMDCFSFVGPGSSTSCSNFGDDVATFDGFFVVNVGDLGLFSGLGTFDVDMNAALTLACGTFTPQDNCSFTNASLGWSGTELVPNFGVKLTYTFDPITEVPEPGTLALFGAGLLGLAFFHQRRRRRGGDRHPRP